MATARDNFETAWADRNFVAVGDPAIGRRQDRNSLQVVLAAAEQFIGQVLVHPVTLEEPSLRVAPLLGAAILMVDRLQILHLRHIESTVEALDNPAGETDVIGMRMGHDQPRDLDMRQRTLEQRGPGGDRFFIAEPGVYHCPAIAVGEQINIHVVEAERQLEPDPQYPRPYLDNLVRAGMAFPRVS